LRRIFDDKKRPKEKSWTFALIPLSISLALICSCIGGSTSLVGLPLWLPNEPSDYSKMFSGDKCRGEKKRFKTNLAVLFTLNAVDKLSTIYPKEPGRETATETDTERKGARTKLTVILWLRSRAKTSSNGC